MPRFLTPEWVEECNQALAGAVVADPGPEDGPGISGPVTVVEEVRGSPDGDVSLVLTVRDGTVRLGLLDAGDPEEPDVTIRVSYEDAAALSKGELTAAEALNDGRIRVRGDLSVLVASQQILSRARADSGLADTSTTY